MLLNQFREQALGAGWFVVDIEGRGGAKNEQVVRLARGLVHASSRFESQAPPMREARGTLKSFIGTLGLGHASVEGEATHGRGDSHRIELDLEEVVEDLSLALREESSALAFFIDEMQDVDDDLMSTLLSIQHRAGQKQWPFYIFGAGLPGLPAALSAARSYAERLFDYRHIGPLSPDDARTALEQPVNLFGASFEPDALAMLLDAAGGYPYFIQTFGQAAWDLATDRTITVLNAEQALDVGNADLDMGFFLARWERVTQAQRVYMHAMAELGTEPVETKAIAAQLGKPLSKLSVTRQGLIEKGLVFAPERGYLAFSVPGMPAYIRRQFDD